MLLDQQRNRRSTCGQAGNGFSTRVGRDEELGDATTHSFAMRKSAAGCDLASAGGKGWPSVSSKSREEIENQQVWSDQDSVDSWRTHEP